MRGRIIHYNGSDGRGLVAAGSRQFPFEIAHWRSDTAPTVNQVVDMALAGDLVDSLTRVPEDVLLKEKAGQLANRLGTAGGAALQSLKESAPDGTTVGSGWLTRLGKPLLVAHALFVISALAMSYVHVGLGRAGRSFTLHGLSALSESLGASVGGAFWTWMAILSVALPLLWRRRWAWLALLLPLLATLKPLLDFAAAARDASREMGTMFGSRAGSRMMNQMFEMFDSGVGFWVCLLTALFIAMVGMKRALLPSSA